MIDLHTHILPGVDDGLETEEEAVAFARIPPFMVTLVTSMFVAALAIYLTKSENIIDLPHEFGLIGDDFALPVLSDLEFFSIAMAIAIGISAGWATSLYLLDMSTPEFMKGLRLFFLPWDIQFAVIKSLSFGLTITSIGCFFGFTTHGGAEGVGTSTTRAVVVSSMVILVLDAFWAWTLL